MSTVSAVLAVIVTTNAGSEPVLSCNEAVHRGFVDDVRSLGDRIRAVEARIDEHEALTNLRVNVLRSGESESELAKLSLSLERVSADVHRLEGDLVKLEDGYDVGAADTRAQDWMRNSDAGRLLLERCVAETLDSTLSSRARIGAFRRIHEMVGDDVPQAARDFVAQVLNLEANLENAEMQAGVLSVVKRHSITEIQEHNLFRLASDSPSRGVRREAVRALESFLPNPAVIAALNAIAANDADRDVRRAAEDALGKK